MINYVCLTCCTKEEIPLNVVRDFDFMDDGDTSVPPKFACENCDGEMYPEQYTGVTGVEYKLSDVL